MSEDPFGFDQSKQDNWVSFSFVSEAGFDRIQATVHGTPEFVADKFGVQEFNGKISQLMKQAVAVDGYFKAEAARQALPKADGQALKPGQPAGSVKPPAWITDIPECDHGVTRRYRAVTKKDGTVGHVLDCGKLPYPEPARCNGVWVTESKGN